MEVFDSYVMDRILGTGIFSGLLSSIPTTLFSIASYVLTSLALYTIASRRGLNKPWLAWIPVANVWILGSISDQYSYVVKREIKSKRKSLLILNILATALGVAMIICAIAILGQIFIAPMGRTEEQILGRVMGTAVTVLALFLPLIGVLIAQAIVRYMALYDIYKSLDPSNCVLYLVLSILIGMTEPFFLFFNRNKDLGMPPRRQEPSYSSNQPPREPWENKDYL